MKRILAIIVFSALCFADVFSQRYAKVDSVMLTIPAKKTRTVEDLAEFINSKFSDKTDKLRAMYVWMARNIKYDVENMYRGIIFHNIEEVEQRTLNSRKTICFGFTATYKAVMEKCGITVRVISGYVKNREGIAVENLSHSWCAVNFGNEWRIIDPTWGSGYVDDNNNYVARINDKHFLSDPSVYYERAVPFDPMWSFSYFPINNSEFYAGKSADSSTSRFFNFNDSIAAYDRMSERDRAASAGRRIERSGVVNNLIREHLDRNAKTVETFDYNSAVDDYNQAVKIFNQAARLFNDFINFRKGKSKLSSNEAYTLLVDAKTKLGEAAAALNDISGVVGKLRSSINEMRTAISEMNQRIDEYLKL